MAPGAPIKFTLYGANDEVIETYSRAIITTRFLERAIDLAETLEDDSRGQTETLEALDQLLVDFYGGQFTLEAVKDGGDISEKMAVLQEILARAGAAMPPLAGTTTPD